MDPVPSAGVAQPAGSIPPLVVDGVGRSFGRKRALIDVSITFEPGEIAAVVGPNGAGKSTLLAILATLIGPTAGSVRWGTSELRRGSAARASLGYVGHEPGLYMDLGALANLELFSRFYGLPEPAHRARELLERVGMGDAPREAPVRTFSRGMQQRVALARALLHEPAILLFDEPSSALDPAGATWLAGELGRERDAGRVVILVTHDLEAAGTLAAHLIILRRGRLVRDERRAGTWGGEAVRTAYEESCRDR